MVNKRTCCIGGNFCLSFIGLALIIMGVMIVDVVNKAINKGVEDKLKIKPNFEGLDAEEKNDFLNTKLNYTYHAFDFANHDLLVPNIGSDASLTAYAAYSGNPLPIPKIKLVEKGPWSVIESDHKYNVSWSADGLTYSYNSWWNKQWATPDDAKAETDTYKLMNLPYLAAIGTILNSTCYMAGKGAKVAESTVLLQLALATWKTHLGAFTTGENTFSPSPTPLATLRFGLIQKYIDSICDSLGDFGNGTGSSNPNHNCFDRWVDSAVMPNADDKNFNLPAAAGGAASSLFALASWKKQLFGKGQLGQFYSIRGWVPANYTSNPGFPLWMTYLTYKSLGDANAITDATVNASWQASKNALWNAYGGSAAGTQSRLDVVAGYLGTFLNQTTTAGAAIGFTHSYSDNRPYAKRLGTALGGACDGALNWADLGYCQFGTSLLTRAAPIAYQQGLADPYKLCDSVFWMDWWSTKTYTTACNNFNKLPAASVSPSYKPKCQGAEIKPNLGRTITIAQAKKFFEMATDATNFNTYMGTVGWYKAFCTQAQAGGATEAQCPFAVPGVSATANDTRALYYTLQARCGSADIGKNCYYNGAWYPCHALFANVGASCYSTQPNANGLAFGNWIKYLSFDVPLFGLASLIATPPRFAGLFTTRTPADVMFGYTRKCKGTKAVCSQDANNDPILKGAGEEYKPGLLSNWSDLPTNWDTFKTYQDYGRNNHYTGVDDVNKAGKIKKYRGYNSFQRNDQVNQKCKCQWSVAACSGYLAKKVCDWWTCNNIWKQKVEFDGLSDGRRFGPFQEAGVTTEFQIWFSTGYRLVKIRYEKDVEFRGIKLRRYVLEEKEIKNKTQLGADHDNVAIYDMQEPEGGLLLAEWFGDVPVVLTRPHFVEGDVGYYRRPFSSDSDVQKDDDATERLATYVDIEPLTGLTMRAHKRLQYTVKLKEKVFDNPLYKRIFTHAWGDPAKAGGNNTAIDSEYGSGQLTNKVLYYPAFWADEWGEIEPKDANDFVKAIYDNRDMAETLEIVGYAVGATFLVVGILGMAYWLRQESDDTLLKLESRATL